MAEKQLARAKQLIQAKHYEDARALLITIDHPTADKWLDRLNSIPAAVSSNVPDYTSKAVAIIVLYFVLFIPGLIAGSIWSKQAKLDMQKYSDVPGAKLVIGLNRFAFGVLVIVLLGAIAVVAAISLSYQ